MNEIREIGCRYNPEEHTLISNSPYISAMRNSTGCKDLGLYRHKVTGNFMIFVWWSKDIMCEIYNCGPNSPDMGGDAPFCDELMSILAPTAIVYDKMLQHNRATIAKAQKEKEDFLTQRSDMTAYMRRHGLYEAADNIDNGTSPWAPADESITDIFKTMGRGRVSIVKG